MIAVSNDCGLKKPASHTQIGSTKSLDHASNSRNLMTRSVNHDDKPSNDGYALVAHTTGT